MACIYGKKVVILQRLKNHTIMKTKFFFAFAVVCSTMMLSSCSNPKAPNTDAFPAPDPAVHFDTPDDNNSYKGDVSSFSDYYQKD